MSECGSFGSDPFRQDSAPQAYTTGYQSDPFGRSPDVASYTASIQPSQEVGSWARQQSADRSSGPFATPSQGSQEVFQQQETERPRGVREKFGAGIVKMAELFSKIRGGLSRTTETTGSIAPNSRLHDSLTRASGYVETGLGVVNGAGNVYDATQSAWDNRIQVAQDAVNYGREAGMRVASAGVQAGLDVVAKRTGVSMETDENGKRNTKIKIGRGIIFLAKVIATGGTIIPKVGIEAGLAARKAATNGAKTEYASAKQQGKIMARDAMAGSYSFV